LRSASLVGMKGLMVVAALLTTLAACSPGAERETQQAGEGARQKTAHQGTTTSEKNAEAAPARERETTTTDSRARWDYVALGDSLAVGVGARRGYVDRYTERLQSETGSRVRVTNLGVSGQTSTQLLRSLRYDPAMRKALRGAEVVTLNIGLNDLGQASRSYETGTCGGQQNKACLREAGERVERNWDATIREISSLASTQDTIIRSAGFGYTPRAGRDFEPYVSEASHHVASAAGEGNIPYIEVHLGGESMSEDKLHPNDKGYRLIAGRLADLGYEPLYPH
jgi:lysophospholipase L1-like esterase